MPRKIVAVVGSYRKGGIIDSAIDEILSSNIIKLLKQTADLLGAKKSHVLYIGLAAREQKQALPEKIRKKARGLGARLATE